MRDNQDMAFQRLCVLPLGVALLPLFLAAGCGKSKAACTSSAECETGLVCNSEGACVSASADASVPESDAAPACPETTHFCAAPVPADWTGPVAGTQADRGETLAACSGAYSTEVSVVGEGAISEGDCGCSCSGSATGVDCSGAVLAERDNATCALSCGPFETCDSQTFLESAGCTAINANLRQQPNLRNFYGRVTNAGSCALPVVSNTLQAAFASRERYCSAEPLTASCEGDALCLPKVEEADYGPMCIYRSGDQVCPAQYPEKEVRYDAVSDDRSCTACSCDGPAIDSICGGTVSYGVDVGCSSSLQNVPDCNIANPAVAIGGLRAMYRTDVDETCTLSGGEQEGLVLLTGETTFCCTEAIADPSL